MVGVGGSGRSSMARLGASINSYLTFSIEITKSYRQKEWYEDIKKMLRNCGLEDQTIQFLFSDTQIVFESFLEDINNLLNSGEIPNLFPPDEKIAICDELADKARALGRGQRKTCIHESSRWISPARFQIAGCDRHDSSVFSFERNLLPSISTFHVISTAVPPRTVSIVSCAG